MRYLGIIDQVLGALAFRAAANCAAPDPAHKPNSSRLYLSAGRSDHPKHKSLLLLIRIPFNGIPDNQQALDGEGHPAGRVDGVEVSAGGIEVLVLGLPVAESQGDRDMVHALHGASRKEVLQELVVGEATT